jgi:very-short-patch-repair endonuclease
MGNSSTRLRHADADRAISSIASRQHGVVTRTQLVAAGVPPGVVERRVTLNRIRRLHRGVYLVSPVESMHARALAAVLACGGGPAAGAHLGAGSGAQQGAGSAAQPARPPTQVRSEGSVMGVGRAVASHWTALNLFDLLRSRRCGNRVHVTVAGMQPRRPGIHIHRVRGLPLDEVTSVDGVPVTTPPRTLLDISDAMSTRDLERTVIEALGSQLTTRTALLDLLARYPRRRGSRILQSVLRSEDSVLVRSEAERLFRSLVHEAGLPEPAVNAMIGGFKVDFVWRDQRLIAEVDGAAYHSTSNRFETDRLRDRTLVAAGYRVIRVTWRQIKHERLALAVQVARALRDGAPAQSG